MNIPSRTILVTGADGFIGQHLCSYLKKKPYKIKAAIRSQIALPDGIESFVIENIDENTDWQKALAGVDTVIHLAGIVHQHAKDVVNSPTNPYYQTNVLGTENLAKQAIQKGVKRIIFISSIKVNGEKTTHVPFLANDLPNPEDDYASSKLAAEKLLWKLSQDTEMDVVVIRPPLVYGQGAKGNLARLEKLIKTHLPLPFKNIKNQRSLISVENLCKFINHSIHSNEMGGKTYLIANEKDYSTPDLLRYLAKIHHQPLTLFSCPKPLLWCLFGILGRSQEYKRMTESLQAGGAINSLGFRQDPIN